MKSLNNWCECVFI